VIAMSEKPASTSVPINELLARRWSPRSFACDRPVSRTQLLALLEAARWAPSCFGAEPWRYLIWERDSSPELWQQAYDCLAKSNQRWVKNAPVLLLSLTDRLFAHDGTVNRWCEHDAGAASMSLCVQAVALGLMVHQMGGFDAAKARALFAIPEQFTPMAMIAVGYQADAALLEDDLRARELAPRKRRALGETFFAGRWANPFSSD
jgi:nitroreductase